MITKSCLSKIRDVIKDNYDVSTGTNFYSEDEVLKNINQIIVEVKKDDILLEDNILIQLIVPYIYFKDSKYSFNSKRKQSKQQTYHIKILNFFGMVDINEVKEVKKSINEPINNPVDKPVNNLVNELVNEPVYQSVNKQVREPIDEQVDNSSNESVNEPINEQVDELINEPVDEPFNEESNRPVKKLVKKLVKKTINEPVKEPLNDADKEESDETVKNETKEIINFKTTADYSYPGNTKFNYVKPTGPLYEPYGTQWYHDVQVDDLFDKQTWLKSRQFDKLRAIKLPEQRTPEWFKMRDGKITASDGGTVVDLNHHEPQYKFVLKKTTDTPFLSNEFCHHGKKYEDIATMIYEYRMNVLTDEFGLIGHPIYDFLGASPDRICTRYKLDGIHKSKYVGRMLEIKCPYVRKIQMEGPIIDHICPIYYWVQTQLQLECCDLEECDFWQCEIKEYESRYTFISDTNPDEPFRSKQTNFEKGCVIQLLPKKRMGEILTNYNQVVYDDSVYIYPPKVEMSPYDCDVWIAETLNDMKYDSKYDNYYFDRVIYWKLIASKNVLINRDRQWFAENLPTLTRVWNYVLFFRENKDKLDILLNYINSRKRKVNKDIMNIMDQLYSVDVPDYGKIIQTILTETEIGNRKRKQVKKKWKLNENIADTCLLILLHQ